MRELLSLLLALAAVGCRTSSSAPSPVDAAVPPPPRPMASYTPGRVGPITDYHVQLGTRGHDVALRAFEQGGARWLLLLDPERLVTRVEPDQGEPVLERDWTALEATPSPWIEARLAAEQHAASLQDSGLTHLLPKQSGLVLTVDLCPSTRHFDLRLVQRLLEVVEPKEKPVPLAFAVSGVWLEEHPSDLARLLALDGRDLDITWVNHSMHHRYDPNLPLQRNFLLESGTNLANEVLDAEVAMLTRGLTPSVFFRFPGLVSEPTLVTFVVALGLIPVGSDAWLAKGQRAKNGSIVLVHGNGNEPKGVDDFLHLLDQERRAISTRQFLLLDLREAVRETEEEDGG